MTRFFSENIKYILTKLYFYFFSLAIHPGKITIATGQVAGHDKREGRVSLIE